MCAESHNTYRKKSIWNCTALNHPDRCEKKKKIKYSKSIFDSLIWFGGGRDACPAAPTVAPMSWIRHNGFIAARVKKKDKKKNPNMRGCETVPGEKYWVSTQLLHSCDIHTSSSQSSLRCGGKRCRSNLRKIDAAIRDWVSFVTFDCDPLMFLCRWFMQTYRMPHMDG